MKLRSLAIASTLALSLAASGALAESPKPGSIQMGRASFIGKKFQGRETASGEALNNRELVAAHPSYPAGTKLRVTNVENGKTVDVRVADRGPAKGQRRKGVIIDLSRAAAERLQFTDEGKAKVKVEVLEVASATPR